MEASECTEGCIELGGRVLCFLRAGPRDGVGGRGVRGGGGIWFTGCRKGRGEVGEARVVVSTEGCIELSVRVVDLLWRSGVLF